MSEDRSDRIPAATITVRGVGTFVVPTGLNLREALRREGLYLDGTCMDRGLCGRCLVHVEKGEVPPTGEMEAGVLGRRNAVSGERLACRIKVEGDMEIVVSRERILEIERSGRWKTVWDSPLWKPGSFKTTERGFGIALDVGTTSIAAALYDMSSTRPLDIRSAANPQAPWGDDIISRLAAAQDKDTADTLRDLLWRKIDEVTRTLCQRNGISTGSVSKVVAVSNSAVYHLLLGLPVNPLLSPPYEPVDTAGMDRSAGDLPFRLKLSPGARIYFPPLAGGFAGSDAVVSVMVSMLHGEKRGSVIDVGTNTEIAVWDGDRCMVATAPSGPAFEGGHIKSGMQAVEGAIWKVDIEKNDLSFRVVGNGQPEGICGTGIVDVLAGMLRNRIIDPSGLLNKDSHERVSDKGFMLEPASHVIIEPQDIATVQKAKGAIAATLEVLLGRMKMKAADLQSVYLSGAFGSRLDLENAMVIGLLPRIAASTYVPAGNTAMLGASMVLLSEKERKKVESLAKSIQHVSVAEDERFEDLFLNNLYFPPIE